MDALDLDLIAALSAFPIATTSPSKRFGRKPFDAALLGALPKGARSTGRRARRRLWQSRLPLAVEALGCAILGSGLWSDSGIEEAASERDSWCRPSERVIRGQTDEHHAIVKWAHDLLAVCGYRNEAESTIVFEA